MKRPILEINSSQSLKGLLALLAILTLSACAVKSTPPGPVTAGGVVERGSYTFMQWEEGLTILIWDDITGSHSNHGSGSTSDPVFRQSGQAGSPDGRGYSYQIETEDGLTARFTIDDKEFNLSQGRLFLIKTRDAETSVRQLSRDVASISPTNLALREFALNDLDVAALISDGDDQ